MIPNTDEARIWKPLVSKLMWAVIGCLVIIGALVYTNIRTNTALNQSRAATARANHAIDCINTTLSSRGPLTAADNVALRAFVAADKADAAAFGVLLHDLLVNAPASKSGPDFRTYVRVHEQKITTADASYAVLTTDQAKRDKTPLGLC